MKSEDAVTKRPRALAGTSLEVESLGWDEPGGHKQVSQGVWKAKKCLVFSSFEHRCIYSIEHDNKYLFSRSERSERRVNNCLSRLRGTALSVRAVWARLTCIRSLVTVQENGCRKEDRVWRVFRLFSGFLFLILFVGSKNG